jgi:alpha-1,6-mannosyltransferase
MSAAVCRAVEPDLANRRRLGFAGLAILAAATVPLAAPGPDLVPASIGDGPGWLLGVYGGGLKVSPGLYYALLLAAFAAHLCVFFAAPALDRRLLVAVSALLITAFALAPPLLSADVFSYVDYARLGAAHGVNPYTHAPAALPADDAFPYVGWTDSPSAYGPLFTLLTYPLGLVSVPAALWSLKAAAGASVLALAALVARIAPARGVDPRRGFVVVALNPLVLVHVVGGAHNDAAVVLVLTAGCAAILAAADRSGGFAIAAAVALKLSTAFAAPFALLGAARQSRFVVGVVAGAVAVAVASLIAFGPHALDSAAVAGENQGRVSSFSIPNLLSEALNIDVDAVRLATLLAYAALVFFLLWSVWRGGDWIRASGWAALGLLLASAWLLPWYVVWALPFAALSRDDRLLAVLFALTALQLAARIPL